MCTEKNLFHFSTIVANFFFFDVSIEGDMTLEVGFQVMMVTNMGVVRIGLTSLSSPSAAHCEELGGEPYLRVQLVRAGRDANYTYSAGARVRVTCLQGHGLNIGNKTAKCSRGRWKPLKPECISREYLTLPQYL